jgi:UDP-N-acetylmuramoyl-tripeptide--D-alanyl-D-alanine ligase
MKNLTLKNMAQACNGTLVLPEGMSSEELEHKETTSVVIDSRKVTKDGMFVAVKGERQDGHSFIPAVAQAGVLGVI